MPCGSAVVIRTAVQVAGVVRVPAVEGEQVTALPTKLVPLKNCTVLVIAGPLLMVDLTVAVRVMLVPADADGALEMSYVVVAWPPVVTVMLPAADGPTEL